MYVFLTIPTWLLFGWFLVSGRFDRHPVAGVVIFAAFAVEAIIHNTLFVKAWLGGGR